MPVDKTAEGSFGPEVYLASLPATSAEAQLDGPGRVFTTYAMVDWDHPTCSGCGGDLVRHILRWDDGSVSICWLCDCEPDEADLRVLETAQESSRIGDMELLRRKGVA